MSKLTAQQNIPNGWQETTLGDVALVTMGQSPSSASYNSGGDGILFLQGKTDFSKDMQKIVERQWTTQPTKIAEAGDLLFTVRAPVGEIGKTQKRVCIGRGLASIRPNKGVGSEFIFQYLQGVKTDFEKLSQGSTFTAINSDNVRNRSILIPPIKEQQKIAEILGGVDEDIAKTQEVIEATEKLKRGLMQQLFTRGIGHTKFKETKIGQIPEEWGIKTFEEFAVLQRGFDLPVQDRTNGQYDLVTSNGVTDTHNQFKVKAPGVVTGRSGTLGNVFYIENDFWPLNTTLYIKDFHGNHEKFVFYKIKSFDIGRFGIGTGVPTLNRNNVHKEPVAVPQYSEQEKIAEILSAVDEKISVNKKLKEKLTLLKKGLMQDLLSGKVRTIIS